MAAFIAWRPCAANLWHIVAPRIINPASVRRDRVVTR